MELPIWDAVVAGATPDHIHNTPVEEPCVHRGWQQHVSNTVEKVFNTEAVWPSLEANERALTLSQSGPLAGSHSTVFQRVTRLEWIQKSSARCSSVASGCHCPSTHAFADVAVSQTVLAIIGPGPAWFRGEGCCGMHLSRGRSKGLDQRDGP